ncbi:MAG: choice-of-anchor L domain-containing protein [Bacteroidales bacterium]|nr:choice-of-anchor L domain-containing protein [Bacteroidales bacterium]
MTTYIKHLIAFVCYATIAITIVHGQNTFSVYAGSAVGTNWTVDSLVQNILLGEGVEVSNVQFNGSSSSSQMSCASLGRFVGGNSTGIGLNEGIVMGTAHVGGVSSTSQSGHPCSYTLSDANNPLRQAVPTLDINNIACLEFDFKCKSDSINFRYVFASVEYPEYACSDFNDAFGFFISGIAPLGCGNSGGGSYYEDYNIALIPNTTQPVTINSINNGPGTSGTASNCDGPSSGQYWSQYYNNSFTGTTLSGDGGTTVLTAKAKVLPCQTYHIKLMICNTSDQALDSYVFLEANSLQSNGIEPTFTNATNPQNPTQVYEGCCVSIDLARPIARSTQTQINVSIGGTATNGGDYANINPVQAFPADTTAYTIEICPYMDGIEEGEETVVIYLTPADGCTDSIIFTIVDTDPITLEVEAAEMESLSNTRECTAVITGGMPNRTVTWTNLQTNQVMTGEHVFLPTQIAYNQNIPLNSLWAVRVEDACHNASDDTVCTAIRRNFAIFYRDTLICQGEPLPLMVYGADSVVWYMDNMNDASRIANPQNIHDTLIVDPQVGIHRYYAQSFVFYNGQWWSDLDSITVTCVQSPTITLSASREEICPGESVTISAEGVSSYSWDNGTTYGSATSHNYTLDSTDVIHVYGKTAAGGCPAHDSILITVDYVPTITIAGPTGACEGNAVELTVTTDATTFDWTSSPNDPMLANQTHSGTITVRPDVTSVYTVTAYYGVCQSSKSHTLQVDAMPIAKGEVNPTTVTLGNMQATFTDMSQNSNSREWYFPDGSVYTTKEVKYLLPDDIDNLIATLIAYNPSMCSDTTLIYAYVDHTTMWIPNAFTPDEVVNNHFTVKMNAIRDYHIKIFDRNGHLMFESYDPEQPWDGTNRAGNPCPQGTYVYFISAHKSVPPLEQMTFSGTITLIR